MFKRSEYLFIFYYLKNYLVWKDEHAVIISLVIVILFRKKNEDNDKFGFGTCSGPNWKTIIHGGVKRFT